MLTPESITRLNLINDYMIAFTTLTTTIETLPTPLSNAQVFIDLCIKELSLDVLKRDGL